MKWIIPALLALAFGTASQATTLRVPEDYSTILAAVDAAVAGDSVLVGPGTWTDRETRTVIMNGSAIAHRSHAFLKPWITVIGTAGAAATVLEGDAAVPGEVDDVLTFPDSFSEGPVRITGLTLRGQGWEYAGFRGTGGIRTVEFRDCVFEGSGIAVTIRNSDLFMKDCVVRDQAGSGFNVSGIHSFSIDWFLDGCLFENNAGGQVLFNQHSGGGSKTTIQNCRFVNNQDSRVILLSGQHPLLVRNNWFEQNSSIGLGGSCVAAPNCAGLIDYNTFVNNVQTSPGSGVINVSSAVDIVSNTLVGNTVPLGSTCAGITIFSQEPHQFTRNVVAGCRGGPAVELGGISYNPTDGCNIYWDNDSGNFNAYVPQPTDVVVDPEFCDLASGDTQSVAASSPCLPENHFVECPLPIGAGTVAGCPVTANVVTILRADPSGPHVSADGQEQLAPFLLQWPLGTTHTIACDSVRVMSAGFRRVFSSWNDGGDREHDVTTTLPLEELTASFSSEYLLTTAVSGPGSVTGGAG